ncbi:MAG: hypothetical protein ACMUEM_04005 [Flavobacteriales bacterium AspAUS03]
MILVTTSNEYNTYKNSIPKNNPSSAKKNTQIQKRLQEDKIHVLPIDLL